MRGSWTSPFAGAFDCEAELVSKSGFFSKSGLLALAGMAMLMPFGANADDADLRAVNNRLDRLERSVNDMRQTYSGGAPSGDAAPVTAVSSDANVRLNDLEDQMRLLNGRIEELSHQVDTLSKELEASKAATELRFQDLQGGAGAPAAAAAGAGGGDAAPAAAAASSAAASSGATTASADAAPTVALPAGTPQVQYDFAIDLLKRGEFPKARDAFKQFLQQHPKDALAGNAQYWLGETYYVQGQYKDAADSFLKGYTTYSKSSKAPDSLLKLGMTLVALKQKDAACATFGQLKEQFPSASPAIVARNKQERQKAGC
jgi:tol-pal system protein YbgF